MSEDFYYEFGGYRLNPRDKSLWRDHQAVSLTPKQIEILLLLLDNSGNTVPREVFSSLIWQDTFVEDGNLTQNIFQLRKTLSDGEKGIEFIETIPKRGYRFVAPLKKTVASTQLDTAEKVENQKNPAKPKSQSPSPRGFFGLRAIILMFCIASPLGIGYFWFFQKNNKQVETTSANRSIAILPFKEISNQSADKQLEIGLADALITKLSGLQKITVRPTSAVIQSKQTEPIQIGRELNVETILTGTIQRESEQMRVNVQMVNVSDGRTLWAENYDSAAKNIFEVQDDISEKILRTLKSQIKPEENRQISKRHTNNTEAFEAYSRGRYFWATSSRTNLSKSIEYFQKAINLDPNYALAYAGLADAHIFFASNNTGAHQSPEHLRLAKANAYKALELDEALAQPHATLGAIAFEEKGNWTEAEKEFLKSIELNPDYAIAHNWYSLHLLGQGDFPKAESEMKKALEIDPVSPSMNVALGQIYYFGKQYQMALTQFEKAVELDPDFGRAKVYLALALVEVGKKEQALAVLEKNYQEYPENTGAKASLGWLYAISEKSKKAQEILETFGETKSPDIYDQYGMAVIYAHLGNPDRAFSILARISGFKNLNMIVRFKFDPRLDILRHDPRFEKLLKIGR